MDHENYKLFIISSLGKALGIPGGVILGPKSDLKSIQNGPVFLSSSPISPAYLFAFIAFQKGYLKQRGRLWENIEFFQGLSNSWLPELPNHPVISLGNLKMKNLPGSELFDFLQKKRILISFFSYPGPLDKPQSRLVINACYTHKNLKSLAMNLLEGIRN